MNNPKKRNIPKNYRKEIHQKSKTENISNIFNFSFKYEEFDENIKEQYIQLQNNFCDNQNKK